MKSAAMAMEYEDMDIQRAITPARPATKSVKPSVKRAKRENRMVGELEISQLFWYALGRVWRAHWRGILFVLLNNSLWVYAIWFK